MEEKERQDICEKIKKAELENAGFTKKILWYLGEVMCEQHPIAGFLINLLIPLVIGEIIGQIIHLLKQ